MLRAEIVGDVLLAEGFLAKEAPDKRPSSTFN
jgi:hypothetical protein